MFLQLAVVQERLPAEVAHECLGSAVEQHVRLQLVVLHEGPPAYLACEWFLACVNADVPLEVLSEGESRPTRLAGEHLPPVDCLMRPERPPAGEGFAACRAGEGMLTSVDTTVALQADGASETLPAL